MNRTTGLWLLGLAVCSGAAVAFGVLYFGRLAQLGVVQVVVTGDPIAGNVGDGNWDTAKAKWIAKGIRAADVPTGKKE